ncbi:uncharacterized protein BDV17DRAFT_292401 [Aspergillus undulatus]|uniref:uncharacterized protein n=1 Tax=Aspergillus undulatus TaxID=1810928 RepID=UPI003CCDB88E
MAEIMGLWIVPLTYEGRDSHRVWIFVLGKLGSSSSTYVYAFGPERGGKRYWCEKSVKEVDSDGTFTRVFSELKESLDSQAGSNSGSVSSKAAIAGKAERPAELGGMEGASKDGSSVANSRVRYKLGSVSRSKKAEIVDLVERSFTNELRMTQPWPLVMGEYLYCYDIFKKKVDSEILKQIRDRDGQGPGGYTPRPLIQMISTWYAAHAEQETDARQF